MEYIHPTDKQIQVFSAIFSQNASDLEMICKNLLAWFDSEVDYSRLNAPFFPLQRSDLDLLTMRSGTCGDYANLIVSTLINLGFDACYAYVHKDCYGDEQDHICAAVKENERCILIDAAQPYRKWYGFDCPHQDFELLSPSEFEYRMKKEEHHWCSVAEKYNNSLLAGLLYAPWIHEECVFESETRLDNVFFLISLDREMWPTLHAYYQRYTKQKGFIPVMASITKSETVYKFSVYPSNGLWDNGQWSDGFIESEIPKEYASEELRSFKTAVSNVIGDINDILCSAGCHSLM